MNNFAQQPSPSLSLHRSKRRLHLCTLFNSYRSLGDDPDSPKPNLFRRILRRALPLVFFRRLAERYQRFSKKAKRIVALQLSVLLFCFALLAKNLVTEGTVSGRPYTPPPVEIGYSSFVKLVERHSSSNPVFVDPVQVGDGRINYHLRPSQVTGLPTSTTRSKRQRPPPNAGTERPLRAFTRTVSGPPEVLQKLRGQDIPFMAAPAKTESPRRLIVNFAFIAFYIYYFRRFFRAISGRGSSAEPIGSVATPDPDVSFDTIQGVDPEVKTQVMEIVDTLHHPAKYARLGARIPRGLLLVGPPGTGKTLLARAVAATARVPLIHCSGSDFVEMFVGRGAARVRNLFARAAAQKGPCIIFIDELDAVGKQRAGDGSIGGMMTRSNDEADQTLNQLLACMDGLDRKGGQVCVLAATNRKEGSFN